VGPTGHRRTAPRTFAAKGDADRWLSATELDISRGTWLDDLSGRTPFGAYAQQWLEDNPRLGPRSRETHERNLRLHLAPLEHVPIKAITASAIRTWYSEAMHGEGGQTSVGQSYRLLRAILNTAVREGALGRNPCQIPGAGTTAAKRRAVASPRQIEQLVVMSGQVVQPADGWETAQG
jgi:hypothetical protein